MNQTELNEVLRLNKLWLIGDKDGKRANLSNSDLRGSDLRGSNLSYSDLRGSNLSNSDLSGSNLRGSNLSGSDLSNSNLSYSNLSYSNLSGSDLSGSNLSGSNLSYSDLSNSNLSYSNLSYSNLRGSDLRGSILPDKLSVFQLSGIGSQRRMTTYLAHDDVVLCGCFKGSMAEFEAIIEKTHASNPRHLAEYRAAVLFLKTCAEAAKTEKKEGAK